MEDSDKRLRYFTYLACGVVLVALAPQMSDIATIRERERMGVPGFEYPVLARALFLMERAVASSRVGISLVNAATGIVAAAAVTSILRRVGARAGLWMAAPTLMLVTVNVDAITALFVLLVLRSWKEGKPARAGVWAGLGTAFKLAPAFVMPALASASGPRAGTLLVIAAAVVWLATNVPFASLYPSEWRFPYEFASHRQDQHGTIWAAFDLPGDAAAAASTIALGLVSIAIALATNRRRIPPETGAALGLIALLGMNKIWQPHYLLWLLPALAFTNVRILPVRVLEVTNLAYLLVIWRQLPPPSARLWMAIVGTARLASLLWVALDLIVDSRDRSWESRQGGIQTGP